MSNLGWYQKMTTLAKKVGGPLSLLGIVLFIGSVIGDAIKGIVKEVKKIIMKKRYANILFTISTDTTDKQGLKFQKGGQFRVLEADGEAVLIELLGNKDNPYFVSGNFLRTISDFK